MADTTEPRRSRTAPDAIVQENAALKDEILAQRKQNDQALDLLLEMREELNAIKAQQSLTPIAATAKPTEQAKFDAELAELKKEFEDYPLIEVFERRAISGIDASVDIRLKGDLTSMEDPGGDACYWKLRWFNFGKAGQSEKAADNAYVKVTWEELSDQEGLGPVVRTDGFVRRGDRGLEVLHKIPLKLFRHKKRRDAARMAGLLESEQGLRDYLANGVAGRAGLSGDNADQAGSFVASGGFTMSVTKGEKETVTL